MTAIPLRRPDRQGDTRLALAALVFGALVIGFTPILVRLADCGPAAAGFWRLTFATPLLALISLSPASGGAGRPTPMIALAGLAFALDLGCWHYGIRYTSVANATVLPNLTPVLVTLASWLFLKERPRPVFLVGMAMAFKLYPGVVILFWIWRRQWRAAITATLTFVVVTAGAWAVWPQSSAWIYAKLLFSKSATSFMEEPGYIDRNASVTGFFLRLPLLSHSTALALGSVASVVVAVMGIWIAVRLETARPTSDRPSTSSSFAQVILNPAPTAMSLSIIFSSS